MQQKIHRVRLENFNVKTNEQNVPVEIIQPLTESQNMSSALINHPSYNQNIPVILPNSNIQMLNENCQQNYQQYLPNQRYYLNSVDDLNQQMSLRQVSTASLPLLAKKTQEPHIELPDLENLASQVFKQLLIKKHLDAKHLNDEHLNEMNPSLIQSIDNINNNSITKQENDKFFINLVNKNEEHLVNCKEKPKFQESTSFQINYKYQNKIISGNQNSKGQFRKQINYNIEKDDSEENKLIEDLFFLK